MYKNGLYVLHESHHKRDVYFPSRFKGKIAEKCKGEISILWSWNYPKEDRWLCG
jgi:hypothetical protein